MTDHSLRMYIANDKEYFIYNDSFHNGTRWSKKDLPFPESLLQLMYLDIGEMESMFAQIDQAILCLYETHKPRYFEDVFFPLRSLADEHIYFLPLYRGWLERINQTEAAHFEGVTKILPRKELSYIPEDIRSIQTYLYSIFAEVFDIDKGKASVQERMTAYYSRHSKEPQQLFQFRKLQTRFELVEQDIFTEVLYPENFYDLIDYSLRECVRRQVRMRVCKNCGRYFAITGRSSAEYCGRQIDNRGRTCRDVGAIVQWSKSRSTDEVFKAYRKEYKKRFARIKAGKILPDDFYKWSELARAEKQQCDNGEITLEEYQDWLARS